MEPKIGKLDIKAHERQKAASRAADNARLEAGQVVRNGLFDGVKILGHRIKAIGSKAQKRD